MKNIILVLLFTSTFIKGFTQVLMTGTGSYSQNFDALLNTGSVNNWVDNSTISSVFSQRTSTSTTYAAGTGSLSTGGLYSFGATGSTERALGTVGSSNLTSGGNFAHGVLLQNTSGFSINALNVTYTLEQWRNGGNTNPNTITFWYKVSSTAISSVTPGSNTGWTAVSILNATSPINTATSGPLDGNNSLNRVTLSNVAIPNLVIPNDSFIMLRWYDPDHTGSDHGLGIDDLSLDWTVCTSPINFYLDSDGDLFGNPGSVIQSCVAPTGYVTNDSDCDDANALINPNTVWYSDLDGDTYGNLNATFTGCIAPLGFVLNSTDCDDNSASVNALSTFYQDSDQDGFGNPAVSVSNCGQPTGYVINSTDCNDNDNSVNAISTWYQDSDNDGFGNPAISVSNCGQPAGYVANNTDCDDSNSSINSSATEIADNIDNDCDGLTDEGFAILTWYLDNDQDGFGGIDSVQSILSPGTNYILIDGDCNDQDLSINPNAQEICDSIDNNCDGLIDNGLTFFTYYVDADGDTYGSTNDSIVACSQPTGYVLNNTDCDDSNASINPGATDVPVNGIDEDCNGVDAPLIPLLLGLYEFTQASACPVTSTSVSNQPTGATFGDFGTQNTICSPAANVFNNSSWNLTQNLDSTEFNEFSIQASDCKTLNLDRIAFNHRCSGTGGTPTWIIRSSLDNYSSTIASGLSGNNNNVNLDDTVFLNSGFQGISQVTFRFYITGIGQTGSTWRMDNVSVYGNILSLTPQLYYADGDGDGYGNPLVDSLACSVPQNFVLDNTDCDDANNFINPLTIWYLDSDGDQIGDSTQTFIGCSSPVGYVLDAGDCDDNNVQIFGPVTYYLDNDGDTFGETSSAQTSCQNPGVGYVTVGGDCNDSDPLINPNAIEICDGIDNDCDGLADDGLVFAMYYVDADGDGFGDEATGAESCSQPQNTITVGGDCDDANDQIYPGATEICDAVDNDCDGSTDEGLTFITYYTDADNDGFGTGSTGLSFCENPGPGFSTNNQDCDDANGQVNPNATEILDNGIDENCDGVDGYLGIQVISDMNVMVSPNPNAGSFTIEFNQLVTNAEINLTDLNGKIVRVYQLSGDSIQISDSKLEKGVYLLNVSTQGNTLIERIIVQ
ncbi:MAG: MopE-related protein [Crocinitomicaceae bacterium]